MLQNKQDLYKKTQQLFESIYSCDNWLSSNTCLDIAAYLGVFNRILQEDKIITKELKRNVRTQLCVRAYYCKSGGAEGEM